MKHYLNVFYYPHHYLNNNTLNIPSEMYNVLKNELESLNLIINCKKEEVEQLKKSSMTNLLNILDCKIYLSLADFIKYIPENNFPCLSEIFTMIASIQGSTSLVESMFSVSSNKHEPNMSTNTLQIHTLFSLNQHIQIRNFN